MIIDHAEMEWPGFRPGHQLRIYNASRQLRANDIELIGDAEAAVHSRRPAARYRAEGS
jgi:hypothetical protein